MLRGHGEEFVLPVLVVNGTTMPGLNLAQASSILFIDIMPRTGPSPHPLLKKPCSRRYASVIPLSAPVMPDKNLSTHLAIMSVSMFTREPLPLLISVARFMVCGIMTTLKPLDVSSTTVRLMPSTATEPFFTICREITGNTANSMSEYPPASFTDLIAPVPSICPVTMWPPRNFEAVSGVSSLPYPLS